MRTRLILPITLLLILTACSITPTHQSAGPESTIPTATDITTTQPLDQYQSTYQPAEPVIPEVTAQQPAGDTYSDIWERIRNNLTFTRHEDNRAVKDRIAWYARNQEYLDRVVQRATPYIYYIVEELEKRDMPLDLALLPIVESAYHPFAYSRSHASGIWQFIPSTGKIYGLKQNWWYDGRRDIVAATRGALDYLEKLHAMFDGDWEHAVAAYNTGEVRVERAVRRNKSANKKTDFFSLSLPRETRGYVPSLLAVATIIADPGKHGLTLAPIPNQSYFTKVDIGGQLDLSTAATLTGLSMDEIYTLNPGFNRWATDPDGPHYLLVPIDKEQQFIQGLAAIPPDQRVGWTQHVILQGESLSQIADKYRTSVAILKETNKIRGNLIRVGQSLLIPTSKLPEKHYTLSQDNRMYAGLKREGNGEKYIYTVRSGDNLWLIGKRYNVSINELCRWNGISSRSILRPGQKLELWVAGLTNETRTTAPAKLVEADYTRNEDGHIRYTVKKGDSLWIISKQFGVTVAQLLKWNNLIKNKPIQPGQTLLLLDAPALAAGA
jgi:membrane-bound lytic murein transglycosylase D